MAFHLSHVPMRLSTGALILDSGLNKRGADEATARGIHGMAAGAYPFLAGMDPQDFVRQLSRAEVVLGVALLVPFIPTPLVALALTLFSGGLMGLYLRTPGLTQENSIRPTQDGLGIAKDAWMLGIGLGLLLESLTPSGPRRVRASAA